MEGCESSENGKRSNNNGSGEDQEMMERKKRVDSAIEIGIAVVAFVGVGLLAWGLGSLLPSWVTRKMMKAPGRDGAYILREVFEDNPAKYFRDLRKP